MKECIEVSHIVVECIRREQLQVELKGEKTLTILSLNHLNNLK